MNLDAIKPRKSANEAQTAAEMAQRNRAAGYGNLLFKDTQPAIKAVARGLQEAIPVQPVSLEAPAQASAVVSGDLVTVLKAMTDGINKAVAAIRGPVQKAAPPASSQAGPASTLNVMLASEAKRDRVARAAEAANREPGLAAPPSTEAQRRREAESREQARKSAAQADADRVMVCKAGPRVMTFRKLDTTLSDAAVLVLSHIVAKWEANERRPVKVNAPDLSRALDLPLATAQAAYTELVDKHLLISAANSLGVVQVQPGIGVTGA